MVSTSLRSPSGTAIVWLILANLFWAGQGIAVKVLEPVMHPIAIAILPLYLITLLLASALFWRRNDARTRCREAWQCRNQFLLAGVGGQLLAQVGMTMGISRSLASNGAILNSLVPIFSAIIAAFLLRERLTPLRIGALGLGLAGVLLLSPVRSGGPLTSRFTPALAGNILIALGCLGSAFYNVYSKRLLKDFSEVEILFFSYLTASITSIPLVFFVDPECCRRFSLLTLREWGAFGFLTIFIYGVSMILFLHALRRVDAIVASASLYLVPIFGAILAMTVLNERLPAPGLVGFGAVMLGMMVVLYTDTAAKHNSCESLTR